MNRIKKGDEVVVITGRDKGKRGTVLRRVDAEHLLVEGVNKVKKHQRPNPMKGLAGGIVEKEMPLHVSNVALFNPQTKKADRVGVRTLDDDALVIDALRHGAALALVAAGQHDDLVALANLVHGLSFLQPLRALPAPAKRSS